MARSRRAVVSDDEDDTMDVDQHQHTQPSTEEGSQRRLSQDSDTLILISLTICDFSVTEVQGNRQPGYVPWYR